MLVKKAYYFRINPTEEQIVLLNKTFGCRRFVWNQLLGRNKTEYEAFKQNPLLVKPKVGKYHFVKKLPLLKKEFPFLKEVSAVALQQSCLDLEGAYGKFFTGFSKHPRFKRRQGRQSFRLVANGFTIREGKLRIAKCKEPITVFWSRVLPSTPSQVTISRNSNGEYYASFLCEVMCEKTSGTKITGIDLGLKDLAICSDGTRIENPRFHKSKEKKLAKLQRQHSKKQKGSQNREKSRIKLAKLHQRVKNTRNDYLHKVSRSLVNENQVIGLEYLKVQNLVKNHRLAKSISDVAWGRFKTFLEYKAKESQHCGIYVVDQFFPSTQTCNCCKHRLVKSEKLKLHQRQWICPNCGVKHDRDINAATNLANEAVKLHNKFRINGGLVIGYSSDTPQ